MRIQFQFNKDLEPVPDIGGSGGDCDGGIWWMGRRGTVDPDRPLVIQGASQAEKVKHACKRKWHKPSRNAMWFDATKGKLRPNPLA